MTHFVVVFHPWDESDDIKPGNISLAFWYARSTKPRDNDDDDEEDDGDEDDDDDDDDFRLLLVVVLVLLDNIKACKAALWMSLALACRKNIAFIRGKGGDPQ
uniref:Uncharacterized protein n=1 Tax=Lotharella oceanica TaxID=641309 RepID=A0A7S2TKC2_9EUKA|mmetsp:Transcript_15464/g.29365  ORF Transcript_15464/g.29365 Transcript_15464/m.29365 type:complete len:102 (+) Transcript_15464:255-560(+)